MTAVTSRTQPSIVQGKEAPYINAPYPDRIIQVHDGDTEGEKIVIDLLNKEWPAPIRELEKKCEYTGPFIRTVLRNKFAPAPTEEEEESKELKQGIEKQIASGRDWSEAFRMGVKLALSTELSETEASEAIGSGFIEGREIRRELKEKQ